MYWHPLRPLQVELLCVPFRISTPISLQCNVLCTSLRLHSVLDYKLCLQALQHTGKARLQRGQFRHYLKLDISLSRSTPVDLLLTGFNISELAILVEMITKAFYSVWEMFVTQVCIAICIHAEEWPKDSFNELHSWKNSTTVTASTCDAILPSFTVLRPFEVNKSPQVFFFI